MEETKKKKAANRTAPLLKTRVLSKRKLSNFWRKAVAERFPHSRPLPVTVKEESVLHAKQKAYNETEQDLTFAQFICWCLDEWGGIIHLHFGWMKKPPTTHAPDLWFFIRQHSKFYYLFNLREDRAWVRGTERFSEEDELCQRMSIGQSYEEASLSIRDRKEAEQRGERVRAAVSEMRAIEKRLAYIDPTERRDAVLAAKARLAELNNTVEE